MTSEDFCCPNCDEYFEVEDFDYNKNNKVKCSNCEEEWEVGREWTWDDWYYVLQKPEKWIRITKLCKYCGGTGEILKVTKTKILFHSMYEDGSIINKRTWLTCPNCNGKGKVTTYEKL